MLAVVLGACSGDDGETWVAPTLPVDHAEIIVGAGAARPLGCEEILDVVEGMTAADRADLASLHAAYAARDLGVDGGLQFVGLPVASETGDPHDKRWSEADGLTTVGPFFETPSAELFPVVLVPADSGFDCTVNTRDFPIVAQFEEGS